MAVVVAQMARQVRPLRAPIFAAPSSARTVRALRSICAAKASTPQVGEHHRRRARNRPVLRNEYVVFSSHQDHDGVRFRSRATRSGMALTTTASTSVALLAIARAWVKQPSSGRRSSSITAPRSAAARLAVARRASVVPLASIGGGAQWRHDRPESSGHGVVVRHPAAAPELDRPGADGAGRQQPHREVRARLVMGSSDAYRGLVLPQRSRPVRATQCSRGVLQVRTSTTTTTRRATIRIDRLGETDPHDEVDVPDGLDRRQRERASDDRCRVPAGAVVAGESGATSTDSRDASPRLRETCKYCGIVARHNASDISGQA